jgi:Uma2 family endonuclease
MLSMTVVQPVIKQTRPKTRRWTLEEYYRLGELGFLRDERVELLDGKICKMPPLNHPHVLALENCERVLEGVFGPSYWVRTQAPIHVGNSAPQPDIAVVAGEPKSHTQHPTSALLIVEVSDTTLNIDRWKGNLYAASGTQDYWILDLVHRQLEVRRGPVADPSAGRFGHRYATVTTYGANDSVAPLALTHAPIRVADLLP